LNLLHGTILKTSDGGESWVVSTSIKAQLNTVHFTSSGTGYAAGEDGVILKKTSGGTGFSPVADDPGRIIIYPNPARETLTISLEENPGRVNGSITIFNIRGEAVLHHPLEKSRTVIDTQSLKPGLYLIRITETDRNRWGKFIRE